LRRRWRRGWFLLLLLLLLLWWRWRWCFWWRSDRSSRRGAVSACLATITPVFGPRLLTRSPDLVISTCVAVWRDVIACGCLRGRGDRSWWRSDRSSRRGAVFASLATITPVFGPRLLTRSPALVISTCVAVWRDICAYSCCCCSGWRRRRS